MVSLWFLWNWRRVTCTIVTKELLWMWNLLNRKKLKFVMWSSSGLISICRNQFEETFDVYLQAKNKLHPSCFPWDIAKILQTCYFGCFGHAWVCTPKVILSTCRKLSCLSAVKKINLIFKVFLKILQGYTNFLFWVFGHACYVYPKW